MLNFTCYFITHFTNNQDKFQILLLLVFYNAFHSFQIKITNVTTLVFTPRFVTWYFSFPC